MVVSDRTGGFSSTDQLSQSVAAQVRDDLESTTDGTAAVIVPPSMIASVASGLAAAGVGFGTAGRDALDQRLTLLAIEDAKGLEFDSVIVVEPSAIVAESPQGLRALYVAFTRATQRLAVVHSQPMPAELAGVAEHSA